MIFSTVIRRCILPAAAVVAEAKLTSSKETEINLNTCRPSDLPIYTPEQSITRCEEDELQENVPNVIEQSIGSVRKTWARYSHEINAYEQIAKQSFDQSKQNVEWLVDYLRKEDNTLPKAGAIGIGALTGLIFGLRGGFFKRTIYATTGALGMASVCYPKEASEYAQVGVVEGKKILTIAYNFAYGVKKDDPPLKLPSLPKLPTSLSEAWDSVKSGTSSLFSDSESSVKTVAATKNTMSVSNENLLQNAVLTSSQDPSELMCKSEVASDVSNNIPVENLAEVAEQCASSPVPTESEPKK